MNQLGDKPEEVRKQLEEEKRQARQKDRKSASRAADRKEPSDGEAHDPAYADEPDSD